MLDFVGASRWLRFALGVAADAPMPRRRRREPGAGGRSTSASSWQTWMAYRRCLIEVSPPGGAPVRFRIDGAGARRPPSLPATTFAVLDRVEPGRRASGRTTLQPARATSGWPRTSTRAWSQRWPAIERAGIALARGELRGAGPRSRRGLAARRGVSAAARSTTSIAACRCSSRGGAVASSRWEGQRSADAAAKTG